LRRRIAKCAPVEFTSAEFAAGYAVTALFCAGARLAVTPCACPPLVFAAVVGKRQLKLEPLRCGLVVGGASNRWRCSIPGAARCCPLCCRRSGIHRGICDRRLGRCLRRGCRERLELVDQARESTGVAVFAAAEVDAAVVDPSKVRTSCAGVGSVRRLCARVARLVAAAMIQLPSAHWPVRSVKNFARMGMMDGGKRRKPRLPFGAWRQTQPVSAEARETLVEFRENDRIG
jgi:hypothetical protein